MNFPIHPIMQGILFFFMYMKELISERHNWQGAAIGLEL